MLSLLVLLLPVVCVVLGTNTRERVGCRTKNDQSMDIWRPGFSYTDSQRWNIGSTVQGLSCVLCVIHCNCIINSFVFLYLQMSWCVMETSKRGGHRVKPFYFTRPTRYQFKRFTSQTRISPMTQWLIALHCNFEFLHNVPLRIIIEPNTSTQVFAAGPRAGGNVDSRAWIT